MGTGSLTGRCRRPGGAEYAHVCGTTLRDAALALGLVTGDGFDHWVRREAMVAPAAEE